MKVSKKMQTLLCLILTWSFQVEDKVSGGIHVPSYFASIKRLELSNCSLLIWLLRRNLFDEGSLIRIVTVNAARPWSNISNTKDRVWPHFQTPGKELKIRRGLFLQIWKINQYFLAVYNKKIIYSPLLDMGRSRPSRRSFYHAFQSALDEYLIITNRFRFRSF